MARCVGGRDRGENASLIFLILASLSSKSREIPVEMERPGKLFRKARSNHVPQRKTESGVNYIFLCTSIIVCYRNVM